MTQVPLVMTHQFTFVENQTLYHQHPPHLIHYHCCPPHPMLFTPQQQQLIVLVWMMRIIFMIRKTTIFPQPRDSMAEFAKKSTETTDSKADPDEQKLNFYRYVLREWPTIACNITTVETRPRIASEKSYAVYSITVRTSVVQYQIKKRYSEFEKLYQRCTKFDRVTTSFPPRTIFQPGWCEEVTSQRMRQLNKFLQEISNPQKNEQIKQQLFDFIHLYENYQKGKIEESETQMTCTDQFLLSELIRLNQNPTNVLESLDKIKLSISQRKKRLSFQVVRQLFMGFHDYSGLLYIAVNSQNELVLMRGLQLINWLISAQAHRDYQLFRRMLLKCLPNDLIIQNYDQLRSHCELTTQYFKLIKQYLSGKNEGDIQSIAKFYDEGESIEEEYARWVKYSNMDSRY